jgi:hypothetical protein
VRRALRDPGLAAQFEGKRVFVRTAREKAMKKPARKAAAKKVKSKRVAR